MAITCDLCKKRAQIFAVGGSFVPTKASVYLRASLYDNSDYWNLDNTPVISIANFSSKTTNTTAQVYADDQTSGFDSKAYMLTNSNGGASDWPVLYYPIKAGITGDFDVYFYQRSSSGFNANLLIDGVVETSISSAVSGSWVWSSAGTISIGDTQQHTLGVQFTTDSMLVDKMIIQPNGDPAPTVEPLTDSPYNTVHAQIYDLTGETPNVPFVIDGYKNTLTDIKNDGWYNFDLTYLLSGSTTFPDDNYALVLWAAGAREKNYVSWELVDSEEYLDLPVAAED